MKQKQLTLTPPQPVTSSFLKPFLSQSLRSDCTTLRYLEIILLWQFVRPRLCRPDVNFLCTKRSDDKDKQYGNQPESRPNTKACFHQTFLGQTGKKSNGLACIFEYKGFTVFIMYNTYVPFVTYAYPCVTLCGWQDVKIQLLPCYACILTTVEPL